MDREPQTGIPAVTLRRLPPQPPAPDEVRIRVAVAGLCRTDLYVARGLLPARAPVILGHELAGVIDAVGGGVDDDAMGPLRPGDPVTVNPLLPGGEMLGVDRDGAFAGWLTVPAAAVHRLPAGMPPRLGAYAEPMAAALAVCKAGLRKADHGLLCGGGRIAELTARVLCAHGFTRVSRWDPSSSSSSSRAPAPPRDAFDFAIETQATAPVLAALVRAVRPGGRIVLKSRPHAPVPLDIHAAVRKELTFAAVCYAPFPDALALLESGRVPVDDLLGPVFPLPDFAAAFARAEESEAAKIFLQPQPDEGT